MHDISRRRLISISAATALATAASGIIDIQDADAATGAGATAAATRIAPIALGFDDATALYPVSAGSKASPAFTATFNYPTALAGTITWSLLQRGTEINSGTASFTAAANVQSVTSIALGALDPDYYSVVATVTNTAGTTLLSETLGLGVLLPTVAGLRPGSAFGLGIRPESTTEITRLIAQRMGVKWTRGVIAVEPDTVCPSPGVFWGQTEIDAARAEIADWHSYGISPLGFINYNMSWNVQPAANGTALQVYQNRPKDLTAHAEMVYHAIAPLSDLVTGWELWNEPWVHGTFWQTGEAQDYRDMVKLIWDRVKPDYPDVALIGGGSVTYNRDIVYAKGSDSTGYIDGSVNHAYGYPDATQYAMTKTQIKMDKAWSQSKGWSGQWQTELGTCPKDSFPDLPLDEANLAVARTLAPTYLLHMLAGAEEDSPIRIFWFSLSYDANYSGGEFNIYDYKTKTPYPTVVAYAAMASLLEDCDLLHELYPTAKSTWGFLFKTANGKGRAAVYADQIFNGTSDEYDTAGYYGTLTLNNAYGIRVYDYLGKQLADGRSGRVTLTVNPWEVLYFDSDLTPAQLQTALTRNAEFDYNVPVKVTPLSFLKPLDDSTSIDVRVENVSPQPMDAVLRITPPAGFTVGPVSQPLIGLQPGEERTVSFPVHAYQASSQNTYDIGYTVQFPTRPSLKQSGSQTVQVANMPYRQITVGAAASQWDGVIPIGMTSVLASGDTKQYTFQSAWDDDFVYVRALIEDDLQSSNWVFSVDPWQFPFNNDSIQIAFDAVKDKTEDLLAGDAHYGKCLSSISNLYVAALELGNVSQLHRQLAPGTNYQTYYPTNAALPTPLGPMDAKATSGTEGRVLVTRDDTNKLTTYEVAIAWSQLPELSAAVQALPASGVHPATMAVQVHDAGGSTAHGSTYWTAHAEAPTSGCYNFAPFWSTGAQFTGGRVDTRWGISR